MRAFKNRRRTQQERDIILNNFTFRNYYKRLLAIAVSTIEWVNAPPELDIRFLELALAETGMAVFYRDDVVEQYIALTTTVGGYLSIYNVPNYRRAYASNGYQYTLNQNNSVLIWNDNLRTPIVADLEYYAYQLYMLDQTFNVNINSQKTPIILLCEENKRLTMENFLMQYDENSMYIKQYNGAMTPDSFKVLNTQAPYVADKLERQKLGIWTEALTYLGIPTNAVNKAERVNSGEVGTSMGHVSAMRAVRLVARQEACNRINKMFGLDMSVRYRDDFTIDLLQSLMLTQRNAGTEEEEEGE